MHIESLQLYTANPGRLLLFYRDVLHCSVTEKEDDFTIHCTNSTLSFSAGAGDPKYHFAFNIPFHKINEAMAWTAQRVTLLDLGGGAHLADFRNWHAKAFYFFDPAGNIVEFIGRENATAADIVPFTGASLLSVSEIGVVTDDVTRSCRQLEELWKVPLFIKQPPTPNFAAVGDDNGLFIVVKEGRHWYPTDQPAQKASFTAHFRTADGLLRQLELSS